VSGTHVFDQNMAAFTKWMRFASIKDLQDICF